MKVRCDIVLKAKIINIIAAACMCICGVLTFFVAPVDELAGKLLIGAMCLFVCGAKLLGYFSNDMYRLAFQFDLAFGIFTGILGILILLAPERLNQLISYSLALYILLDSVLKIQTAVDAKRFGIRAWPAVLSLAILMGLFALVIILTTGMESGNTMTLLSIALIAFGAEHVWFTAYTVRVRTRKKGFEDYTNDEEP